MAAGGDEDAAYSSFTDSFPSSSSSFSSRSVSESCSSCGFASVSEGDTQSFADGGIYDWILLLIEKGVVARFIDRHDGVYELDWQDVVWKYWFEFRAARKDKKRSKQVEFNHRTASNSLRAALLNSYKDKGAKEFPEKKVLDRGNKTIKRSFRMPFTVIEKLSNCTGPDKTTSTKVGLKTSVHVGGESFSPDLHIAEQQPNEEASYNSTHSCLVSPINFSSLHVDAEESYDLIDSMVLNEQHNADDLSSLTSDQDLMQSSSSDSTMATSQYDAGSSGYETLTEPAEENLIKEMDPNEGPYQGGNMSYIFLEQSLVTHAPGAGNRCKVIFSSPKHCLTPREVIAAVKNPFTIKVRVPHCPRLSGRQLACGRLTVQVLVKTMEGCYIGETIYTYTANLQARFEHCVKALDDKDMELGFSCTADELVQLGYNNTYMGVGGSHLFNFATLQVVMFVAVKERAYNLLLAFLQSSVVSLVFQHCKHELVPFIDFIQTRDAAAPALQMCKELFLDSVASSALKEHCKPSLPSSQDGNDGEPTGTSEKGYDGGSELETSQELKLSLNDSNELEHNEPGKMEKQLTLHDRMCDKNEKEREVEGKKGMEENDNSVQFIGNLTPECKISKESKEEAKSQVNDKLWKPKIVVLRKPCSPVPISRSRSSFPDPRTDVFVELQVRKNQRPLGDSDCQDEPVGHMTVSKQLTVERVPVAKHQVAVDVKHNGTEQSARDWESKYVKRVSGKLGYWFRFYEPNCELLLMFTLYDKPHAVKSEEKLKTAVLDHVTVVVETINWKGPFSREAKTEKEHGLALTRQVPLVSLSRSQMRVCLIMNGLHKLCDNGEWVKFKAACEKLRHCPDADLQVAILLEQAIAFLYQNDLENAEVTAMEALTIVSKAENHQLLVGRAYYYLAHIYRREKKLGEAERCIDLSKQNLRLMDVCLDQSFMAYEEGNVMKEFISSGAVLRRKLLLQAKLCFEHCLDVCRRLPESDSQVIPHTHSFALTKIAMLLLDCGSTSGRERCVSATHVAEAKRFLHLLQEQGLDKITQRRKLQFMLACSDLQYRLSNYQAAAQKAHQALQMAEKLGFSLEVIPACDRIKHIRQLLASEQCTVYACPEL